MTNNVKLGVEVLGAHDLIPKEQGTANTFVEVHFDGQRFCTTVKARDLGPVWNEQFYFTVSDASLLPELDLEACVYHTNRASNSKASLGRVRIPGTSFVFHADAVPLYYPLERRTIFSRAHGELGLKVFLTNDPAVTASSTMQDFDLVSAPTCTAQEHDAARQFEHVPRERQHRPTPRPLQVTAQPYYVEQNVQPASYSAVARKAPPAQAARMYSSEAQQPVEFQLKETSPTLGGGRVVGGRVIPRDKGAGAYDLVERMEYLFVRVVKARDLPGRDITGSLDPFVEVHLGNYKMGTRYFEKNQRPEWDEAFAFPKELLQATTLEVVVKDKNLIGDGYVGQVQFDLIEVPTRVPPDSPLAPEWYRLVGNGVKDKGELMLAVWYGTQADECFPSAIHARSVPVDSLLHTHIRGMVYPAPRMWYLRVNVVEAQDIIPMQSGRLPDVFVKVRLGGQMLKTKPLRSQTSNFTWNEDLMFVVADPFEEDLIVSVEDLVGPNKDVVIGEAVIPLVTLPKRADKKAVRPVWYNLRWPGLIDTNMLREDKFYAKLNLRVCLEGGYHVLDEATHYCSDLRPTMKQLWKSPIGRLEVGVLNATGLGPTKTRDGRGTCDAYCVAKYGQKWVRTRTILDSLSPRFNEQYTWDVHDHGTVLTVGVFDSCHLTGDTNRSSNGQQPDTPIGKVRVRLSMLETGRVYTHTYPLLVLHPSGVKKTGELHLAIRFSARSLLGVLFTYSRPLLPKMHYTHPLSIFQQRHLRHHAVQIVAQRLGRMEPPVRRDVVEYLSDAHAHLWSMRRSKANFFRLVQVFSWAVAAWKWFGDVCQWKSPATTVLVHVLFVILVLHPDLILPTVLLYMVAIGLWNYRFRPRYPPHMDTVLSLADAASPEDLEEELDSFPSARRAEVVRMRYDRLRHVAGRIQTVVGNVATQGERLQALIGWRDPRATAMFLLFCLAAAVALYVTPFRAVALCMGFFRMRHPRLRSKAPAVHANFFRRLPAKSDILL